MMFFIALIIAIAWFLFTVLIVIIASKKFYRVGTKDGLTRGIALSIGFLEGAHGLTSIAEDLARNTGIRDKKELIEAGVDQYDLDQIGDVLPDVYSDGIERSRGKRNERR